jgi:hypothetical protein
LKTIGTEEEKYGVSSYLIDFGDFGCVINITSCRETITVYQMCWNHPLTKRKALTVTVRVWGIRKTNIRTMAPST